MTHRSEEPRCPVTLDEFRCQHPAGHDGRHHSERETSDDTEEAMLWDGVGDLIATLHPNTLENLSHVVYALHECARSEMKTLHWKVTTDGIAIYEKPEAANRLDQEVAK